MQRNDARAATEARIRNAFKVRFGDALDEAMRAAGASNPKQFGVVLAQRDIPVTQQDLSAWAKGRIPGWDRVDEVAKALGVSWEWLLTGREPKQATGTGGQRTGRTARTEGQVAQEDLRRRKRASGQ